MEARPTQVSPECVFVARATNASRPAASWASFANVKDPLGAPVVRRSIPIQVPL